MITIIPPLSNYTRETPKVNTARYTCEIHPTLPHPIKMADTIRPDGGDKARKGCATIQSGGGWWCWRKGERAARRSLTADPAHCTCHSRLIGSLSPAARSLVHSRALIDKGETEPLFSYPSRTTPPSSLHCSCGGWPARGAPPVCG